MWDGDVLQQEIGEDHSLTYVYEPDSFVPLAHIRSEGGAAQHRGQAVHVEADAVRLPLCAGDALEPARTWRSLREQPHHAAAHASALQAEHDAGRDVIHYYDCDHLGTPLALLTEGGKTVWSADTTAWGRVWQEPVKQISQPLRFQGQYQDDETLLHYNRYRYYDPDTGRFITQDPIGLMGGENLYQYAANPVGWVDPLGLASLTPSQLAKQILALQQGNDVTGCNFKDAASVLFGAFPGAIKSVGAGNKSKEKVSRDKMAFKRSRQENMGQAVYHMDYKIIPGSNGVLYGHEDIEDGHPHKNTPHINVITPKGRKATIYIEKQCRQKGK